MDKKSRKLITKNKIAYHEYNILETYQAGIVLYGTEIKSIRKNAINLKDSYAKIDKNNECWLYNAHISHYIEGNRYNHPENRDRKLLLTKREILKIMGKIKKDNLAFIPLSIFLSNGFAKVELGLAKGKKLYDKREDLAKKSQNRDIQRAVKNYKY